MSSSASAAPREGWAHAFQHDPGLFDAFRAAEDPEHRIVARLAAHVQIAGRSVLEVGCGTGRTTEHVCARAARYVALDASRVMLAVARGRVGAGCAPRWLVGRAQALPLADASVDVVIATWVLANLRPGTRALALGEIERVTRAADGAGTWLVENHWSSELQELRGLATDPAGSEIAGLTGDGGFSVVDEIDTEIRFPSDAEAARVLGTLCGRSAAEALARRPRSRVAQRVVILHRPRTDSTLRSRS